MLSEKSNSSKITYRFTINCVYHWQDFRLPEVKYFGVICTQSRDECTMCNSCCIMSRLLETAYFTSSQNRETIYINLKQSSTCSKMKVSQFVCCHYVCICVCMRHCYSITKQFKLVRLNLNQEVYIWLSQYTFFFFCFLKNVITFWVIPLFHFSH